MGGHKLRWELIAGNGLGKTARKAFNTLPYLILVLQVLTYMLIFTATTFNEYNRFWYGNFDLGIPDQGIWLLSRFQNPYLTTRGLHLFGDHASYIHLLVAPIYWIWDDVKALLLLHTAALAIAAVPVYLIARDKFGNNWTPLVFSLSYIMLPAVHYSNLDQGYHYETFMVPFLLFGYWFLTRKMYKPYYLMIFLSLICKEEIAVSIVLFGVYVALKHDRKAGVITSAAALFYLLMVMKVLFPIFNQEGAFYTDRTLGSYGKTPLDKVKSFTNTTLMEKKLNTEKNRVYVKKLLESTGYMVLLEPIAMAASGSLWLNMLQDWSYAHEIQYHYVTPIIPFIYIALINGIGRFRRSEGIMAMLLYLILLSTFYGNYHNSPGQSTLRHPERMMTEIENFDEVTEENAGILELMDSIPDDASVSATYDFVSHLSHRKTIYMFPNPFRINLYGIEERGVHPDKDVDYVLLDMRLIGDEEQKHGSVSKVTKSGKYELVREYRFVQLWKYKGEPE
ncbi:MAG: DUF2079 domain-containing protein [Candidatus Altiarchaeales archaeon]|nr:DUF2079 domain-containing protein [Candidatus Altiarchaeales archaeon]MBD3416554.1 DUF2079 domain-containing protein [Candidatus Altiarchaeales archaeon]